MAKAILDLSIQAGYPFYFSLDLNDSAGLDLESEYSCWFECESIGKLQLSVNTEGTAYEITISKENTDLLLTNLEEYVIYTIKTSDSSYDKLLSGRLHIDAKVRT